MNLFFTCHFLLVFLLILITASVLKALFLSLPIDQERGKQNAMVNCGELQEGKFKEELLVRRKRFMDKIWDRVTGKDTKDAIHNALLNHGTRLNAVMSAQLEDHAKEMKTVIAKKVKQILAKQTDGGKLLPNGQAFQKELLKIERKLDKNAKQQQVQSMKRGLEQLLERRMGELFTQMEQKMGELVDGRMADFVQRMEEAMERKFGHILEGFDQSWMEGQANLMGKMGTDLHRRIEGVGGRLENVVDVKLKELMRRNANEALQTHRQLNAIKAEMQQRMDGVQREVQKLRGEMVKIGPSPLERITRRGLLQQQPRNIHQEPQSSTGRNAHSQKSFRRNSSSSSRTTGQRRTYPSVQGYNHLEGEEEGGW